MEMDATLSEVVEACKENGAAILRFVSMDKDGQPLSAVIVVNGAEPTQRVVAAVEAVEEAEGWA